MWEERWGAHHKRTNARLHDNDRYAEEEDEQQYLRKMEECIIFKQSVLKPSN